jgi:hypothetical protein
MLTPGKLLILRSLFAQSTPSKGLMVDARYPKQMEGPSWMPGLFGLLLV